MTEEKKCTICKGTGKCRHCHGRGTVMKHVGATNQRCLDCNGSGKCPACKGEGTEK
jgi:hypothetical protein